MRQPMHQAGWWWVHSGYSLEVSAMVQQGVWCLAAETFDCCKVFQSHEHKNSCWVSAPCYMHTTYTARDERGTWWWKRANKWTWNTWLLAFTRSLRGGEECRRGCEQIKWPDGTTWFASARSPFYAMHTTTIAVSANIAILSFSFYHFVQESWTKWQDRLPILSLFHQ